MIVFAFTIPLGVGTNNLAEIQDATYGLQWCGNHGYNHIIFEVDSQLLITWITSNNKAPSSLHPFIYDLKDITA